MDGDTLSGQRESDPAKGIVEAPLGLGAGPKSGKEKEAVHRIIDDFLRTDASSPDAIVRFTKRHGILIHTQQKVTFAYNLRDWREMHEQFKHWCVFKFLMRGGVPHAHDKRLYRPVCSDPAEAFEMRPEGLYYRVASLYRFMLLHLLALPKDEVRVCSRIDCGTIFLSTDRKQKYCGPECTREAMLKSKREYFQRRQKKSKNEA